MTKTKAINRMKNADLSEKIDNYDKKIIVLLNDTPETMTYHQRHHEKETKMPRKR